MDINQAEEKWSRKEMEMKSRKGMGRDMTGAQGVMSVIVATEFPHVCL
jgi:hypothetical protein